METRPRTKRYTFKKLEKSTLVFISSGISSGPERHSASSRGKKVFSCADTITENHGLVVCAVLTTAGVEGSVHGSGVMASIEMSVYKGQGWVEASVPCPADDDAPYREHADFFLFGKKHLDIQGTGSSSMDGYVWGYEGGVVDGLRYEFNWFRVLIACMITSLPCLHVHPGGKNKD